MSTSKQTILRVDGMTCSACVRHVSEALRALEGVGAVEVDLGAGKAVVDHDPDRAPVRALVEAIGEAGYTAEAAG